MKNILVSLLVIVALVAISGCSSGVRIGTPHHHVAVGASAN